MQSDSQPRRGFLLTAAGLLAALPFSSTQGSISAPDEAWLRGLNGKHRQFFDVGFLVGGAPLRRVNNFLSTYASSYGLKESDINAVFGAHGGGLGFVLDDALWAKYELGAIYRVNDPATTKPATRNVFLEVGQGLGLPVEASVRRLMGRGVVFLACNNSISGLAEQLAQTRQASVSDIRRELSEGVVAGVTVVPAMLIAGNRAQESGLTYAAL